MNTSVPSVKTKLAVHCPPAVTVCTPGCTAAVAEGAHVGAAEAPSPNEPMPRTVRVVTASTPSLWETDNWTSTVDRLGAPPAPDLKRLRIRNLSVLLHRSTADPPGPLGARRAGRRRRQRTPPLAEGSCCSSTPSSGHRRPSPGWPGDRRRPDRWAPGPRARG